MRPLTVAGSGFRPPSSATSMGGLRSTTSKILAAAPCAAPMTARLGAAWPSDMAPMSAENSTCITVPPEKQYDSVGLMTHSGLALRESMINVEPKYIDTP
jgi:hypothetical protein